MFELLIRWLIAAAAIATGPWLAHSHAPVAYCAGGLLALFAGLRFAFARREPVSSGTDTALSLGEALVISVWLGSTEMLGQIGFLTAVPLAIAAKRSGAPSGFLAAPAAGIILAAHASMAPSPFPTGSILAQAFGALLLALLAQRPSPVFEVRAGLHAIETPAATEPGTLELREGFRRMRDLVKELEQRTKRDRVIAKLAQLPSDSPERYFSMLADTLRRSVAADGLAIYTPSQVDDQFVHRSASGQLVSSLGTLSISGGRRSQDGTLAGFDAARAILLDENERARHATVPVIHQGKVVAALSLRCLDSHRLELAKQALRSLADVVGARTSEVLSRISERRRLITSELLYAVATTTQGSQSPIALAERAVHDLHDAIGADHVGIFWLDEEELRLAAHRGMAMRLIESMSFAGGSGIPGWLGIDAPELALFDPRTDARCPAKEAAKRRIGSYIAVPIRSGVQVTGLLAAGSHTVGRLGLGELESLRLIAAELGLAFSRLEGEDDRIGMATPAEFQRLLDSTEFGSIAVLQPLRRERILELHGAPALENAMRTLCRRLRPMLPPQGALLRRPNGDLIAFLPEFAEADASRWANEAAASASLIGLPTGSGDTRLPLGLRARVAAISRQSHEVLDEIAA